MDGIFIGTRYVMRGIASPTRTALTECCSKSNSRNPRTEVTWDPGSHYLRRGAICTCSPSCLGLDPPLFRIMSGPDQTPLALVLFLSDDQSVALLRRRETLFMLDGLPPTFFETIVALYSAHRLHLPPRLTFPGRFSNYCRSHYPLPAVVPYPNKQGDRCQPRLLPLFTTYFLVFPSRGTV